MSKNKKQSRKKEDSGVDYEGLGIVFNKLMACGLIFMFLFWLFRLSCDATKTSWPW